MRVPPFGFHDLLLVGIVLVTVPAQGVSPLPSPLPPATRVTLANSMSDETDPHISESMIVFSTRDRSSSGYLEYFDLSGGLGNGTIGGGLFDDSEPDVSGSVIVFTRRSTFTGVMESAVHAVDFTRSFSPLQLDWNLAPWSEQPAVGASTVAWVDRSSRSAGDVFLFDLNLWSGQFITSDASIDREPAVSPGGGIVVWEKCATVANCDIYGAELTANGPWSVSAVTMTPDPESSPDVNAWGVVVYAGSRASSLGGADIYWRAVPGGAEMQLELPGLERNPSISANVILFESRPPGATTFDLYAYEITTNKLFQLTNTPFRDETLNDVTVSSGGLVRAVWSVFEGGQGFNVYALWFQLPLIWRDESGFIASAGALTTIDFDTTACGTPIVPASGGTLAGTLYANAGVTFDAGVIFPMSPFASVSAPSPPNIITNTQLNTPTPALVDGTFSSPVSAVGISNVGAEAVLRVFDFAGSLLDAIRTDTDVTTVDFVGIVSPVPIHRFEFDWVSGIGFGADDLLFTSIATPNCGNVDPQQELAALLETIQAMNLHQGWVKNLLAKVQNAMAKVAAGKTAAACEILEDLNAECEVQRGGKLTTAQADRIITDVGRIKDALRCP